MATPTYTTGANGHAVDANIDQLYSWWPPRPAPPAPLPEAPASVNVRLTIDGREVQLTLRDTDETRLLKRLTAVLKQYPVPTPPAPTPTQGQGEGFCLVHHCAMQENTKDGRSWYSHKTQDGWCKGHRR